MPIVLQTVVVIDLTSAQRPPEVTTRCDGCSQLAGADATIAMVRNRNGPAAVRQVTLCPDCLQALEQQAEDD